VTPSGPAPRRRFPVLLLLAALAAWPAAAQVTGLRGFRDHSLCCAIGMPSIHGADGSFDPAPDPVLSRRRAPAPPAPDAAGAPAARLPIVRLPLCEQSKRSCCRQQFSKIQFL
jgi:hypothetical protein